MISQLFYSDPVFWTLALLVCSPALLIAAIIIPAFVVFICMLIALPFYFVYCIVSQFLIVVARRIGARIHAKKATP